MSRYNTIRKRVIQVNPQIAFNRSIGLTDILLAIDGNHVVIESSGQFGEATPDGVRIAGFPKWKLNIDDLNFQSEEMVDFIYELLK